MSCKRDCCYNDSASIPKNKINFKHSLKNSQPSSLKFIFSPNSQNWSKTPLNMENTTNLICPRDFQTKEKSFSHKTKKKFNHIKSNFTKFVDFAQELEECEIKIVYASLQVKVYSLLYLFQLYSYPFQVRFIFVYKIQNILLRGGKFRKR